VGGLVVNAGSRSTLATPPRIARAIARLRPAAVSAAPIDFLSWMRILEEDYPKAAGTSTDAIKLLLSSAELCSARRVEQISEHFGLTHVDVYACVEGLFSLPCTCGDKHLLPIYKVELFDEDLGLIGEFGTGRIAFTNLVKESTPMIRYLLDDWVTVRKSDCPHGFNKSVVPHGRYELCVRFGDEVVGVEPIEDCLFQHGLFGDYHLVIRDREIAIRVEEYAGEVPAKQIQQSFGDRFGLKTRVEAVPFGTLTDYRNPRGRKPILKIDDQRSTSTQEVPEFL
jgi:phenylacetate-CoA ligase